MSGQNGGRSNLKIWLAWMTKYWCQDKHALFKLRAAAHRNGRGTVPSVAVRGH